jgi:hypothetical protein
MKQPKPKVIVKSTKVVVKAQPKQKKLVPVKRAMSIADSLSMESNKKSGRASYVNPKDHPVISKINKFVGGKSTSELLKSAGKDTKKAELIYKRVNEVSDKNNKQAPSSFYKSDYDSKR